MQSCLVPESKLATSLVRVLLFAAGTQSGEIRSGISTAGHYVA